MKLGILSRAPKSYSTQRLRAAAVERGHDVKVLNTLRFAIDLQRGVRAGTLAVPLGGTMSLPWWHSEIEK